MTTTLAKPAIRPARPEFSSGPCAKRPGWTPENLRNAVLGRSHRSKLGKARLKAAIDQTREVLEVPADFLIGIVAGSDTGAVEMAMWSMLGARPVQLLAFESFGKDWVTDVTKQLKLPDVEVLSAPYGQLPDTSKVDPAKDLVFTWNGTTSGVRVPNADFISADREGITICDATSAAFAQDLDWTKLDVVTFSWQKALGGEGAHGVLILSPRAVARLESYTPAWPMPKLFRMTKANKDGGNKVSLDIFEGATINTPSMLCVEDALDALKWASSIGGLQAMQARADQNLKVLADWVAKTPWVDFLAATPEIRSNTSVCLKVVDPAICALPEDAQADFAKKLASLLEKEGAALDIGGYRDAPAGLRIWCGATVEASDLEALTPWLDWAFATVSAELAAA
ncbi:phosphoserine transaminase [Caulobacter vibrioides]|uniref:phosphoserine transaminase n=2 Tax=Caulobacter vibrioides TaxID=155892 RepID=Q9A3I8_CAUVC|nr:phosphoserine transaminase [Caulobacter vibrioides]YP_002518695.1 phosphoserine aminotransferase [Caulobacter vibrioides NA1000]AAK25178.1 phosphoserine aminotransferase [Caulobacter vibrioides CB15]ACL96787.1 phosphoserine aminotransferase [Caulobacter vibrioides NA1000]ATC30043.1 phosphoserine transaminase [Caulobacter vibrioides]QXZ51566.1 phosphoserine transaminase [Caulobacter vibrioides]